MAVLGLILLAAAGVLTAAVVTSNTNSLSMDLWGVTVSDLTLGVVFVAGMITTVLAVVGLGLLMSGLRRSRRLRKERLSLRRENEQLAQRVESTPPADSASRHDDRTQVIPDGGARPGSYDTGASAAEGHRSILPNRQDRVPTDSGPRGA